MQPRFPPLFHVSQMLFTQREVKRIAKGSRVKVRQVREVIGSYRYQIEFEDVVEWCYEHDLGKSNPMGHA